MNSLFVAGLALWVLAAAPARASDPKPSSLLARHRIQLKIPAKAVETEEWIADARVVEISAADLHLQIIESAGRLHFCDAGDVLEEAKDRNGATQVKSVRRVAAGDTLVMSYELVTPDEISLRCRRVSSTEALPAGRKSWPTRRWPIAPGRSVARCEASADRQR